MADNAVMKDVLCVYDPDWAGIKFKVSWNHKSQIHFIRETTGSSLTPYCQECMTHVKAGSCNRLPEGTYEEYVVERIMKS